MATSQVSNARTWYLSLTAKWCEADGFSDLQQVLAEYVEYFPLHHVLVPERSLHSTVFAILGINDKPSNFDSVNNYATSLFERLHKNTDLVNNIQKAFRKAFRRPLKVIAYNLKCFDNGTTVQFEPNKQLEEFRDSVRPHFESPVKALINNSLLLESLLCNQNKSCGAKFYGSVARSPSRRDAAVLRWKESLPGTTLTFRRIHLLVSDDALTNPLCPGKNDIFIDLVDGN